MLNDEPRSSVHQPRRCIMAVRSGGRFERATVLAHGGPIVAGLALMFAGLVIGSTIGIFAAGVPVGLAGLTFFLWGVFGKFPE
jgi:hypothetical protein